MADVTDYLQARREAEAARENAKELLRPARRLVRDIGKIEDSKLDTNAEGWIKDANIYGVSDWPDKDTIAAAYNDFRDKIEHAQKLYEKLPDNEKDGVLPPGEHKLGEIPVGFDIANLAR